MLDEFVCKALHDGVDPPLGEYTQGQNEGVRILSEKEPDQDATDETLKQITALLERFPGVRVAWTQKRPALVRIGLAISTPQSLALLAHVTCDSNFPLRVEVDWKWSGRRDDPDCVRYDLRVPLENSNLPFLGGMIVRYLRERSLINVSEADTLLKTWNWALN